MKPSYFITLDVESTNGLDNPICYDLGWIVHTTTGKVVHTASYIVYETFFDENLMKSAYYYDKIDSYLEDIKNEERIVARFSEIKKTFLKEFEDYEISAITAFNSIFDYKCLRNTSQLLLDEKYFYPYGVELLDTMKMARSMLGKNKRYTKFCKDNNYMTKNNRVQMKAETVYRYLSKNNNFSEVHKGYDDCVIETEIFAWCMKNRKRCKNEFKYKLFPNSTIQCKPMAIIF